MAHHLTPQATLPEGYAAAAQDVALRDIAPEVVDLARREEPLQLSEDVAEDRTTAALPPRQVEDLASCISCRHPNAFPSRPAHARVARWMRRLAGALPRTVPINPPRDPARGQVNGFQPRLSAELNRALTPSRLAAVRATVCHPHYATGCPWTSWSCEPHCFSWRFRGRGGTSLFMSGPFLSFSNWS